LKNFKGLGSYYSIPSLIFIFHKFCSKLNLSCVCSLPFRFELYDIDVPTPVLSQQDFLGSAECNLGQIVSAGPEGFSLPLQHPQFLAAAPELRKAGSIILIAEELASLKDEVI